MRRNPSIIGDLQTFLELFQIIRREKPQIVHTHTAKAGVLGRLAAWMAGVPVIIHTFHGHVLSGYFGPALSRIVCSVERFLAKRSTVVVTLSPALKNELSGKFKVAAPERFEVVPLGRELGDFFDGDKHRGEFRRELGVGQDEKLIGSLGRLVPIKDYGGLIEAFSKLEGKCRLVLVGEGPLRTELEAVADRFGVKSRVIFTGWRSDLARIYADLDLFVISSLNEGTPLSMIEAMASGCPIVGTRVGGIPDILSWASSDSVVPPGDPTLLAQAMNNTLKRGRTREYETTARKAAQTYTAEALTERMAKLYQRLLSNSVCRTHSH